MALKLYSPVFVALLWVFVLLDWSEETNNGSKVVVTDGKLFTSAALLSFVLLVNNGGGGWNVWFFRICESEMFKNQYVATKPHSKITWNMLDCRRRLSFCMSFIETANRFELFRKWFNSELNFKITSSRSIVFCLNIVQSSSMDVTCEDILAKFSINASNFGWKYFLEIVAIFNTNFPPHD